MAQIDIGMHFLNSRQAPSADSTSNDQRQSWMKSLEAAGWKRIFDTMHNFPGAPDFDVADNGDAVLSYGAAHKVNAAPTQAPAPALRSIDANGGNATTAPDAPSTARVAMEHVGRSFAVSAVALRPPQGEDAEGTQLSFPRRPISAESQTVSVRKVLVLPTGEQGLEVWIRDAGIQGAQMQMLLADIRRNAREQGGEVVRVSVNGRQVYADPTDRVKPNQAKGD